MKVINKLPKNERVTCDCGSLLEYDVSDIKTGRFGCAYIKCPECNRQLYLDGEEGKTLTGDNIEFPKDFCEPAGVDIDDSTINDWIKKCLDNLKDDEEDCGTHCHIGSGNTMVFIEKYEDEFAVYVTKSYYETSIPR